MCWYQCVCVVVDVFDGHTKILVFPQVHVAVSVLQPHLIDIAVALPGQLRVCALAKQTRELNAHLLSNFQESRQGRDRLLAQYEDVERRYDLGGLQLRDTNQILDIMKSKLGPESARHCHTLEQRSMSTRSKRSKKNGYLQIKMRYYRALNLRERNPILTLTTEEQRNLEGIITRNLKQKRHTADIDSSSLASKFKRRSNMNSSKTPKLNLLANLSHFSSFFKDHDSKLSASFSQNDAKQSFDDVKSQTPSKDASLCDDKRDWKHLSSIVQSVGSLEESRERVCRQLDYVIQAREKLLSQMKVLEKAFHRTLELKNRAEDDPGETDEKLNDNVSRSSPALLSSLDSPEVQFDVRIRK